MAITYKLIEAKTLGSNAASITFSSIPNTYSDLHLITSIKNSRSGVNVDGVGGYINGNNSGQISGLCYWGTGGIAAYSSSSDVPLNATADNADSNIWSNGYWYFPRYKDTSINKTWIGTAVSANSNTNTYGIHGVGWNSNSAAISSITITPQSGTTILAGSSFYLYGILNA